MNIFTAGAALTAAISLVAPQVASASLQQREGGYYDTDLNITWLSQTIKDPLTGHAGSWDVITSEIGKIQINGAKDWGLPGTSLCVGHATTDCPGGAMGHLWRELGNGIGDSFNTGGIFDVNLYPNGYWTATEFFLPGAAGNTDLAYYFSRGWTTWNTKSFSLYGLAVHDGDVLPLITTIPEPESYALMLAGLGMLGLTGRQTLHRRRPCQSEYVSPPPRQAGI